MVMAGGVVRHRTHLATEAGGAAADTGVKRMEHPHVGGLSDWRPLARGSLAVVWEARQLSLDRPVAVKVYHRGLDRGDRRRFLLESATAGQLSGHPGVVTLHDAGILTDDRPYLIMELCPGGSLTSWLSAENRASEERIRDVGVRIADALAAVHRFGVLHRDVKPANILIDRYGNPGLAGFGLASVAGDEATWTHALHVAPAYAPPEVFGTQPATEAGDVFSLAATLYALLGGSPPRDVGSDPVSLEQMAEISKRPIRSIPGVNRCLMDILMAALSQDPAARPTAVSLRDQLAELPADLSKQVALVGDAEARSSVFPLVQPAGSGHSAVSTSSHGVAVAAAGADSWQVPDRVSTAATPRSGGRRRVVVAALAAALIAVVASATTWLANQPAPSDQAAPPQQSATLGGPSPTDASSPEPEPRSTMSTPPGVIQLADSADSAKPSETVRIQGTYGGAADTFLRIERWEGGKWLAFPILTKTDRSGQFTAYVEARTAGSTPASSRGTPTPA